LSVFQEPSYCNQSKLLKRTRLIRSQTPPHLVLIQMTRKSWIKWLQKVSFIFKSLMS